MSIRIIADVNQPSATIEIPLISLCPITILINWNSRRRAMLTLFWFPGFRDLVDDARGVLMDLLVHPPFRQALPKTPKLDFTHSKPSALDGSIDWRDLSR
jgi:hypothetical protein